MNSTVTDLEFFMLLKGNPLKKWHLWQHVAVKLSLMFQFHLVPFAFTLVLGDPMISFLLSVQ